MVAAAKAEQVEATSLEEAAETERTEWERLRQVADEAKSSFEEEKAKQNIAEDKKKTLETDRTMAKEKYNLTEKSHHEAELELQKLADAVNTSAAAFANASSNVERLKVEANEKKSVAAELRAQLNVSHEKSQQAELALEKAMKNASAVESKEEAAEKKLSRLKDTAEAAKRQQAAAAEALAIGKENKYEAGNKLLEATKQFLKTSNEVKVAHAMEEKARSLENSTKTNFDAEKAIVKGRVETRKLRAETNKVSDFADTVTKVKVLEEQLTAAEKKVINSVRKTRGDEQALEAADLYAKGGVRSYASPHVKDTPSVRNIKLAKLAVDGHLER